MKFRDITGQKFNRLTAVSFIERRNRHSYWLFKCDCGKDHITSMNSVTMNNSKSCGCLKIEKDKVNHKKHGMTNTKEFRTWSGMKSRCYNPKLSNSNKKNYYDKGIKVCDRWIDSFENFYSDMGKAPTPNHSIDRIDVNGDYTPDNCRWATQKEQCRNKGNNVLYTINGVKKTLIEWCEDLGVSYENASQRILRLKWPIERALEIESDYKYQRKIAGKHKVIFLEVDGVSKSLNHWCSELNLKPNKVYARVMALGWNHKQALELSPPPEKLFIGKYTQFVEYKGEKVALNVLAKRHGHTTRNIKHRIEKMGWDIEKALSTPLKRK